MWSNRQFVNILPRSFYPLNIFMTSSDLWQPWFSNYFNVHYLSSTLRSRTVRSCRANFFLFSFCPRAVSAKPDCLKYIFLSHSTLSNAYTESMLSAFFTRHTVDKETGKKIKLKWESSHSEITLNDERLENIRQLEKRRSKVPDVIRKSPRNWKTGETCVKFIMLKECQVFSLCTCKKA